LGLFCQECENDAQSVFLSVSVPNVELHRRNRRGWDTSETGIMVNILELMSKTRLKTGLTSLILPNIAEKSRITPESRN